MNSFKPGLRNRYEIKIRAVGDQAISVSNADWDIRSATQGAVHELMTVLMKAHTKGRDIAKGRERDKRRD